LVRRAVMVRRRSREYIATKSDDVIPSIWRSVKFEMEEKSTILEYSSRFKDVI
jgi:hypothetical protein